MPSTVTGKVTLDGSPLTTGNVAFNPVGGGAVSHGTIQSDGSYHIRSGTDAGLESGDYVVTVVATKPPSPPVGNEAPKPPELITPAKYQSPTTSDLKCSIKPGNNTFSPELKSS